jgi:hypothetical protein
MTIDRPNVVVSYAEFLTRRERRRRIASELEHADALRTIEGEALAVAAATPRAPEDKRREDR